MPPRIAFIVQRYGSAITGGSEAHCRMVAEYMARCWQVEVITTCAADYITWANHYPAGTSEQALAEGHVTVRRFPVAMGRRKWLFDRAYDLLAPLATADKPRRGGRLINPLLKATRRVLGATGLLTVLEKAWLILQGPYSPALTAYVRQHSGDYDAIIAFSYVYATSFFAIAAARCPVLLVPTAHDDPAIRFSIYRQLFARVDHLLANTPEELALLHRHFPTLSSRPELSTTVGCGIATAHLHPPAAKVSAFQAKHGLSGPYMLYIGRIEPFKGCGDLFREFLASDLELDLVLVGKAEMAIPKDARIIPLGFVTEQDKALALAGCEFLVMPSPFESLSLVLLEAFACGKPALVNGACAVLKGQVQRSGGGAWFERWPDFAAAAARLHQGSSAGEFDPATLAAFVDANYSWPAIAALYQQGLTNARRHYDQRA